MAFQAEAEQHVQKTQSQKAVQCLQKWDMSVTESQMWDREWLLCVLYDEWLKSSLLSTCACANSFILYLGHTQIYNPTWPHTYWNYRCEPPFNNHWNTINICRLKQELSMLIFISLIPILHYITSYRLVKYINSLTL